uniref:Protein kinase domain-containing protein n=1 Tax=Macrostomum lignano TaxID=282301 RepID=A0A1I8IKY4_9PLAT
MELWSSRHSRHRGASWMPPPSAQTAAFSDGCLRRDDDERDENKPLPPPSTALLFSFQGRQGSTASLAASDLLGILVEANCRLRHRRRSMPLLFNDLAMAAGGLASPMSGQVVVQQLAELAQLDVRTARSQRALRPDTLDDEVLVAGGRADVAALRAGRLVQAGCPDAGSEPAKPRIMTSGMLELTWLANSAKNLDRGRRPRFDAIRSTARSRFSRARTRDSGWPKTPKTSTAAAGRPIRPRRRTPAGGPPSGSLRRPGIRRLRSNSRQSASSQRYRVRVRSIGSKNSRSLGGVHGFDGVLMMLVVVCVSGRSVRCPGWTNSSDISGFGRVSASWMTTRKPLDSRPHQDEAIVGVLRAEAAAGRPEGEAVAEASMVKGAEVARVALAAVVATVDDKVEQASRQCRHVDAVLQAGVQRRQVVVGVVHERVAEQELQGHVGHLEGVGTEANCRADRMAEVLGDLVHRHGEPDELVGILRVADHTVSSVHRGFAQQAEHPAMAKGAAAGSTTSTSTFDANKLSGGQIVWRANCLAGKLSGGQIVWRANCLAGKLSGGQIVWRANCLAGKLSGGQIVWRANCLAGKLSGGQIVWRANCLAGKLSGGQIVWRANCLAGKLSGGQIVWRANCLAGKLSGGQIVWRANCLAGKLSGGQIVWRANCLAGKLSGGQIVWRANCLAGKLSGGQIVWRANCLAGKLWRSPLSVILSNNLEPGSFRFVRELVAKKTRLNRILELVQPRVFQERDMKKARRHYQTKNLSDGSATDSEAIFEDKSSRCLQPPALLPKQHPPTIAQKLEEQIQAGVSFELESPRGIKFLSLYALRELTMRKNELKALENSLTKQITAMRTEVQSVLRFLEPVGADIPTDNSEPSFWPINSWEKYVQFASSPNEHISTLKSLLRSCKRDKWSDALMAMLNESLSKEMQAVINLIGSDMRSRAVAAGVATNLTDAQLGFQSTLLSHFQKAITFIYGATAEAGRPSEQSVRNTCRQQLKHGGDRLKGRSHRTGSALSRKPTKAFSGGSDSRFWQRRTKTVSGGSDSKPRFWQRRTKTVSGGSDSKPRFWQRRTKTVSGGSDSKPRFWQRRTKTVSGGSDSKSRFWQRRTKTVSGGSDSKPRFWQRRTKTVSGGSDSKPRFWQRRTKTVSGGSDSKPRFWQRRAKTVFGGSDSKSRFWQRCAKTISGGSDSKSRFWQRRAKTVFGGSDSKSRFWQRRAKTQPFIFFFPNTIATISGRSAASGDSKAELPIQKASEYSVGFSASKAEQPSPPFSKQYPVGHHDRPSKTASSSPGSPLALLRHHIADVVPRVPVEALFEPALVQVVPDEAHASAQHKHAVEGADLNEFVRFLTG